MRVGMAVPQEGLALALAAAFGLGGAAARFAVLAKTLRRLSKV